MFWFFGQQACGILVPNQVLNIYPCVGRWSFNHWTTGEALEDISYIYCILLILTTAALVDNSVLPLLKNRKSAHIVSLLKILQGKHQLLVVAYKAFDDLTFRPSFPKTVKHQSHETLKAFYEKKVQQPNSSARLVFEKLNGLLSCRTLNSLMVIVNPHEKNVAWSISQYYLFIEHHFPWNHSQNKGYVINSDKHYCLKYLRL